MTPAQRSVRRRYRTALKRLEALGTRYDEWAAQVGAPALAVTQARAAWGLALLSTTSGSITDWHPDDAGWLSVTLDELEDRLLADGVCASVRLLACFLGQTGLWAGSTDALLRCLTLLELFDPIGPALDR